MASHFKSNFFFCKVNHTTVLLKTNLTLNVVFLEITKCPALPSKLFCNCWLNITLFSFSKSADYLMHLCFNSILNWSLHTHIWRFIFVSIGKAGLVTDAVANFFLAIAITLRKQLMKLNCLTQVISLNREWIEEAAAIILVVILFWSIPVPVHSNSGRAASQCTNELY